jgi:hypothetical protein
LTATLPPDTADKANGRIGRKVRLAPQAGIEAKRPFKRLVCAKSQWPELADSES